MHKGQGEGHRKGCIGIESWREMKIKKWAKVKSYRQVLAGIGKDCIGGWILKGRCENRRPHCTTCKMTVL